MPGPAPIPMPRTNATITAIPPTTATAMAAKPHLRPRFFTAATMPWMNPPQREDAVDGECGDAEDGSGAMRGAGGVVVMSVPASTACAMEPPENAVPGRVDVDRELTYLRDGVDITDRPDLQTRI